MTINGSSELLSQEDTRLAVSNAIGLATSVGLNACIGSDVSQDTKSVAEIAGAVVTFVNNLWRQSITARLPLAQTSSSLRRAVLPISYLGQTVLANAFALDNSPGRESLPGVGLSLIAPVASAAIVGHNALQKLGRCFSSLTSRPWDALKAIPIHLFNLASSASWAISSCSGVDEWQSQNRFFQGQNAEISQLSHAFWNPGLRIQAEEAESAAILSKIHSQMDTAERDFLSGMKTQDPSRMLEARSRAKAAMSDLNQFSYSRHLLAKDRNRAAFPIRSLSDQMDRVWSDTWSRWTDTQKESLAVRLEDLKAQATRDLDRVPNWELFPQCRQQSAQLSDVCERMTRSLPEINRHDYSFLSTSVSADAVDNLRGSINSSCEIAAADLRDICLNAKNRIVSEWSETIKPVVIEAQKASKESQSFDQFQSVYDGIRSSVESKCSNAKSDLYNLWALREGRFNANNKWITGQILEAREQVGRQCDQILNQMEGIYLERVQKDGNYWEKFKAFFSSHPEESTAPLQAEGPRPSNKVSYLAEQILKGDPTSCEGAKAILAAPNVFDQRQFQKHGCGYIRKLARELSKYIHPDKNPKLGEDPIMAVNEAVDTFGCRQGELKCF